MTPSSDNRATISGTNGRYGTSCLPILVVCVSPQAGHYLPMVQITTHLLRHGFEAHILGPEDIREKLQIAGCASFVSVNMHMETERRMMDVTSLPQRGQDRLFWAIKHAFLQGMPSRHRQLKMLLEYVRTSTAGTRKIVILQEACFLGSLPFKFGAPLPHGFDELPPVVNINVIPLCVGSIDTAPFGLALHPVAGPEGQQRNIQLYLEQDTPGHGMHGVREYCRQMLDLSGAQGDSFDIPVIDSWYILWDATIQLCGPGLEYPRGDLHESIKFGGCLPPKGLDPGMQKPAWWDEVVGKRKRIILIAQGTLAVDPHDLIVPAFKGLANMEDFLVIGILGIRGAKLSGDVEVPGNAKVLDYFPYDALLPHADVFVINAGYGGFTAGVMHGVPMVLGGDDEDKPEVSARGEWAGIAVNLGGAKPTPERVRQAVETVLEDQRYNERAKALMRESEELSALEFVERQIVAV